jgi:hypothetical protein
MEMRCREECRTKWRGPARPEGPRVCSILVSTLSVLGVLALTAVASASVECSQEVVIGDIAGYDDVGVSLDVAPNGEAWVVWKGRDPVDEDEDIYIARMTEDGWSEERRLNPENTATDRFPEVSIGDDGVGWVIWYQSSATDRRLCVSHGGGEHWSAPVTIYDDPGRWDDETVYAVDSTDVWVATATLVPEADDRMILVYHWQGTAWDGPWQLGISGNGNDNPTFAIDQSGEPWLIWLSRTPGHATGPVLVSSWTGDGWSPCQIVNDDPGNGTCPCLIFDGEVPMALWTGNFDTTCDIEYSRFENGEWTPAGLVNLPDYTSDDYDHYVTCVKNGAGDVAAVWDAGNNLDVFSSGVFLSWWDGSSWTPEQRVSGGDYLGYAEWPSAAMDGDGRVWVAWDCYVEAPPIDTDIRATACGLTTTPVSFGAAQAQVTAGYVTVQWYAGGEAEKGPFNIWRTTGATEAGPPQTAPPEDAERLNDVPITGPPFEWVDTDVPLGETSNYWVEWERPGGSRFAGPASVRVESDFLGPARVLFVAPNPASGGSCFHYEQKEAGRVDLALFTVGGREIVTLTSASSPGTTSPCEGVLCWDGTAQGGLRSASGVYVWALRFDGSDVPGQKGVMTLVR